MDLLKKRWNLTYKSLIGGSEFYCDVTIDFNKAISCEYPRKTNFLSYHFILHAVFKPSHCICSNISLYVNTVLSEFLNNSVASLSHWPCSDRHPACLVLRWWGCSVRRSSRPGVAEYLCSRTAARRHYPWSPSCSGSSWEYEGVPSLAGTRAADPTRCCLQTTYSNKCRKLSSAMVFYAMVSVILRYWHTMMLVSRKIKKIESPLSLLCIQYLIDSIFILCGFVNFEPINLHFQWNHCLCVVKYKLEGWRAYKTK